MERLMMNDAANLILDELRALRHGQEALPRGQEALRADIADVKISARRRVDPRLSYAIDRIFAVANCLPDIAHRSFRGMPAAHRDASRSSAFLTELLLRNVWPEIRKHFGRGVAWRHHEVTMAEDIDSIVLEDLRRIRASQERTESDISELKTRVANLEEVTGRVLSSIGACESQNGSVR
jgi:hypothetical protein